MCTTNGKHLEESQLTVVPPQTGKKIGKNFRLSRPSGLRRITGPIEGYKVLVLTLRIISAHRQEHDTEDDLVIFSHHLE